MAVAAGALFLWEGCSRTADLAPEPGSSELISFGAETLLLRNADTKTTTDEFTENGESFKVFGERVTSSGVKTNVFDGVEITHHYTQSLDYWDYEDPRPWIWGSQSERYDFVAIYPAREETQNEYAAGNLSVSTHYDYLTGAPNGGDTYDILAATYRRNGIDWGGRYNIVPLNFSHMGSAVGVKITNTSSTKIATIVSIHYENLVVSANARASLDNYGQSALRWTNLSPSDTPVRRLAKSPATEIGPGDTYPDDAELNYQIMIPQNLVTYGAQLVVTYKVDDIQDSAVIILKDVERNDGSKITSWDIGYKYTYNVSMRLDGGLLVTVTTTPWDVPVEGETPGILI